MSLCCELSGAALVEPVVAPTGHIFEKRIIESHLEKNATCPITGRPLSKKDLIPLACTAVKKPSAVLAGDPADLLRGIQDHIDALNLENYRLLKERDQLRQQVTQLLYLRDGSTRVVAQKLEEIKGLQNRIALLESGAAQLSTAAETEASPEQIAALIAKWETLSANLLQARKKREVKCRSAKEAAEIERHDTQWQLDSDTTCFDLIVGGVRDKKASRTPCLIASGTASGRLEVRNLVADEVVASLGGHTDAITVVRSLVYPSVADLPAASLAALRASSDSCAPFQSCFNLLTASRDGTVRHWKADELNRIDEIEWLLDADSVRGPCKAADTHGLLPASMDWSCQHVFRLKQGPVRALDLHPSGTHAAAVVADNQWTLLDLTTSQPVCDAKCNDEKLIGLAIQPDGMVVIGASTTNRIPVWDLRTREVKAAPAAPDTVTGNIASICFSETGYHIVTATTCGQTLLWDLRKSEVIQSLALPGPGVMSRFDNSGKHILSATENGTVLHSVVEKKKYGETASFEPDEKQIACLFDKLSDDFLLTLGESGLLTMYHF